MIGDRAIAQLLVRLYAGGAGFDYYEPGPGAAGICWALKRTADADVILLRGSQTLQDWIRDVVAIATPFSHAVFGPVHPGFEIGVERAARQILTTLHPDRGVIIAGHSLGAGRAALLTALLLEWRYAPVLARVAFGEPKPGFRPLADYIARVPARSYRNTFRQDHDLVTSVPLTFPPEEYVHPSALTDVSSPPAANDPWGIFALHRMELYAAAPELLS